jgi:hypothetical protein
MPGLWPGVLGIASGRAVAVVQIGPVGVPFRGPLTVPRSPALTSQTLMPLALAAIEIRGIQVHIGVAAALQWPIQKRLHQLVDLLTDATHLRLGDAALGAQGRDQGIAMIRL